MCDVCDNFDFVVCPGCEVELASRESLLGQLGNRVHYRCRYCGMGFTVELSHQCPPVQDQDQQEE